jgi:glycogen(starch) synthase
MAAGTVVIGTTTGGTGEVLVEDETGLTFPPENAHALASQVARLNADPGLQQRLSLAGSQVVRERFSFHRMVDELESLLFEVASQEA